MVCSIYLVYKVQIFHQAKKNLLLFPEMRMTRKIFTWSAAKFFLTNLGECFKVYS